MVSFLEIPRELRDQIIEEVLNAEKPIPEDSDDAWDSDCVPARRECRIFQRHEGLRYESWRTSFLTNPKAYEPNSSGLLLTNHQLRAETLSCLRRLTPAYHLNVASTGYQLWPTWTRIPATPSRNTPVDLVITCHYQDRSTCGYSTREEILSLFALVMRFLRHGPVGPLRPITEGPLSWKCHRRMNEDGDHFIIRTLHINYVSRPGAEKSEVKDFGNVMHCEFMRHFFKTGRHGISAGDLFLRALGRIVVSIDGEQDWTCDVGKWFPSTDRHQAAKRSAMERGVLPRKIHSSYLLDMGIFLQPQTNTLYDGGYWGWCEDVCQARRRRGLDAPDLTASEAEWADTTASQEFVNRGCLIRARVNSPWTILLAITAAFSSRHT